MCLWVWMERPLILHCMCNLTDLATGFICTRQISFSLVNLRVRTRRGARAKIFRFHSVHWNDMKFWAQSVVIRSSVCFRLVISLFFSVVHFRHFFFVIRVWFTFLALTLPCIAAKPHKMCSNYGVSIIVSKVKRLTTTTRDKIAWIIRVTLAFVRC